ncbi:MAG TPA: helix-turn-helix domain-containing protein [Mycobacterium sp.]|nr:helix-turn-helix domain-containing protein [Mycobacterium sp.]
MSDRRASDNVDSAEVAEAAILVSHRIDERVAETTQVIQDLLVAESPELAQDTPLLQLLHDTVIANVDTYFSAIRHNIPVTDVKAPTIALEHARRLAQRDVPMEALVRAYRLGHSVALKLVLEEIRAADLDPELTLNVFEQMSVIMFGYIDQMSQHVVAAYQAERERWLESRNAVRGLRVREILSGADFDIDTMTTSIRYPLRRIHVAVVVWYQAADGRDNLTPTERVVKQLAESVKTRESPLFIPADDVTGWAWIPVAAEAAPSAVARIRACAEAAADQPWVAVGDPLPGVEGFRRSHQQALAAHTLAIGAGAAARRVTAAGDPGLSAAALLGDNAAAARAWVGEVLGPLASATDGDERMRETLRVFLRTGSSFKAAGEELHFHVNTMKYRVHRAVERRGRPIADDRLDVEIALLLCHWYGAAVLH